MTKARRFLTNMRGAEPDERVMRKGRIVIAVPKKWSVKYATNNNEDDAGQPTQIPEHESRMR